MSDQKNKRRSFWKVYLQLRLRGLAWFFVKMFCKTRIEREKLLRLSGLIDKEDTLYYKWSPDTIWRKYFVKEEEPPAENPLTKHFWS